MTLAVRTESVQKALPGGTGTTFGVRAPGQGIYEQKSDTRHPIGDRLPLHGGRVFYYGRFGESCAAGVLVAPDTSDNDLVETDNIMVVSGNYDGAIGTKRIEVTLASQVKNEYAGGTLHLTDDTGEGHTYLIKANSTTGEKLNQDDPDLNAVTSFMIELYDGLVVAVAADTDFAIQGSPWDELDEATTTDKNVSGVSMIAMTQYYCGWVQTWGVATVLAECGSAIAIGDNLCLSETVAGAVQLKAADNTGPRIGYALMSPDDGGHVAAMLQIMP